MTEETKKKLLRVAVEGMSDAEFERYIDERIERDRVARRNRVVLRGTVAIAWLILWLL